MGSGCHGSGETQRCGSETGFQVSAGLLSQMTAWREPSDEGRCSGLDILSGARGNGEVAC